MPNRRIQKYEYNDKDVIDVVDCAPAIVSTAGTN